MHWSGGMTLTNSRCPINAGSILPAKLMKITDPDVRDPRGSGSRKTEGLFTSELGMRSDEPDSEALRTRTISLSDF
jgi:hypothetical protein